MTLRKLALVLGALLVPPLAELPVGAEVPAEQAARLGADLTPLGAERAGNAEGTMIEVAEKLLNHSMPDQKELARAALEKGLVSANRDFDGSAARRIHALLGRIALDAGDLDEARRHLLAAFKRKSANQAVLQALVYIALQSGQLKEAMYLVDSAIQSGRAKPGTLLMRARLWKRAGRF